MPTWESHGCLDHVVAYVTHIFAIVILSAHSIVSGCSMDGA
eukprot:CAMPEP_0196592128 /NCGR_PEP_ID=MMETSP1081-20130531/71801_1 /TAXON_ID=36882 /ORGANISM="Pyramimonas amylifera, Strain CCMP720" /LENGTH=40 /DNA_ID= /DNA_START= /DNA_END= /DNA_ORIENTATION=